MAKYRKSFCFNTEPSESINPSRGLQSTNFPRAYVYLVPVWAFPSFSSNLGRSSSAEKNTSKGAPFIICAKCLPEDPGISTTLCC